MYVLASLCPLTLVSQLCTLLLSYTAPKTSTPRRRCNREGRVPAPPHSLATKPALPSCKASATCTPRPRSSCDNATKNALCRCVQSKLVYETMNRMLRVPNKVTASQPQRRTRDQGSHHGVHPCSKLTPLRLSPESESAEYRPLQARGPSSVHRCSCGSMGHLSLSLAVVLTGKFITLSLEDTRHADLCGSD
eukprot:SAG31_NODE_4081_length_3608_cov_3.369336_7_plen_192_part_00